MKVTTVFLLLILVLSSCASWQKCNRATAKIERAIELCPEIETHWIDTISITVPEVRDSLIVQIDSIPYPVIEEKAKEAVATGNFKPLVEYVNRPCLTDTIRKETEDFIIRVIPVGMGFDLEVTKKEKTVSTTTQKTDITPPIYRDIPDRWWEVLLKGLGVLFIIAGILVWIRVLRF